MSERDREPPVQELRRHVLGPVRSAERVIERDVEEVLAERRAFETLDDRIADVEPGSGGVEVSALRQRPVGSTPRGVARVRTAVRETVMSVPHYDEVYDESLETHLAAELSPELAAPLADCREPTLSPSYKALLRAAVRSTIDDREAFHRVLTAERDSLRTHRVAIGDVIDDGNLARHTDAFEDRLDDIARRRQGQLRTGQPTSRLNGHDVCTHLYRDPEWTYPVLTAVTRLRGAVEPERETP